MELVPYHLSPEPPDSDTFYRRLDQFGSEVLHEGMQQTGFILKQFSAWKEQQKARPTDLSMTMLELLTFGVLWNEHADKALKSGSLTVYILRKISSLRSRFPGLKPSLDNLKSLLLPFILKGSPDALRIPTKKGMIRFVNWLEATGEYPMISVQSRQWAAFCLPMQEAEFHDLNRKILDFSNVFTKKAEYRFAPFLRSWNDYQQRKLVFSGKREDSFFTSGRRTEYYLNFIGSWIINRSNRKQFLGTARKMVVLPGCMRKAPSCKANLTAYGLKCTGCTNDCQVNILCRQYTTEEVKVTVIPHNSDYMRLVSALPDSSTGIIGVACALNLLEGGYALLHKGFAAQCVILDFSGCKKHWTRDGIPTSLSAGQLNHILCSDRHYTARVTEVHAKTVA